MSPIRVQAPTQVRVRSHRPDSAVGLGPPISAPGSVHRSRVQRRVARRIVSEATYRRRRVIVGTALAVFVAVGAVAAHDVLAGSGSVPASAAVSQPARPMIIAQPGETLWEIANRYRGDIAVTRYVDKLVSLNGGPSIVVGQSVILP